MKALKKIWRKYFKKKRKTPSNIAHDILRIVYSYGDDYSFGENHLEWWASYSNDYPLQHGKGWRLSINKNDYTFTTTKAGKHKRKQIEEEIKKYKK